MATQKDKKLKPIGYYRKMHKAIPAKVYKEHEKGTASKTLHDAWGSPYVVHKYNYAPWGHPPSGKSKDEHYSTLRDTLTEKGKRAQSSKKVRTSRSASGTAKKKTPYAIVYDLVGKLDKGKGASKDEVERAARKLGVTAREIEVIYDKMMDKGLAYEPNMRSIRRIDKISSANKGSKSQKGSSGRARANHDEIAYRNALESFEKDEAERMLAYSDSRTIRADLEDAGYSDTRKTWKRTGARTQLIARNKLALQEMKDRGLY